MSRTSCIQTLLRATAAHFPCISTLLFKPSTPTARAVAQKATRLSQPLLCMKTTVLDGQACTISVRTPYYRTNCRIITSIVRTDGSTYIIRTYRVRTGNKKYIFLCSHPDHTFTYVLRTEGGFGLKKNSDFHFKNSELSTRTTS